MASPVRRQVSAESKLRYGQSLADLLGARHTAHRQYQNDVNTAVDSAHAIKAAAKSAVGQLKAIYDQAGQTRQIAGQQISAATNLAQTPHNALAMALQAERGAATQRFAGESAAAQGDAVARGQSATAGLLFAKKNALQNYRATRSDLMAQTRGVHADQGLFAQTRTSDLLASQGAAAQSQANSDRTYALQVDKLTHTNPITGKPLPSSKVRTPAQQHQVNADSAAARDQIGTARTWIQRLGKGNSLQKALGILKTGGSIPVPTGQTDASGQAKVHYMTVPKIPGDFLRAAVELESRGYISTASVHKLRTRNVHVPKEWLSPTPGQVAQKIGRAHALTLR